MLVVVRILAYEVIAPFRGFFFGDEMQKSKFTYVQSRQLLDAIKKNSADLDACPGHDFSIMVETACSVKKFQCRHCGGEVDAGAKYWFDKGRASK